MLGMSAEKRPQIYTTPDNIDHPEDLWPYFWNRSK